MNWNELTCLQVYCFVWPALLPASLRRRQPQPSGLPQIVFSRRLSKKTKQETMGQHGTRQRDMYKARTATFQPKLQGYRNCSIRP